MIAYKGFTEDLTSIWGDGNKDKCCFIPGETKRVEKSQTARSGFHCCENPFECLNYYGFGRKNRFFKVEAAGDIDEDGGHRIACTEITLLEELTPLKFALEGIKYMINHPDRDNWEQDHINACVRKDKAESKPGGIAIARGEDPIARGPEGSILGLIVENNQGIQYAKLLVVSKDQDMKWIRIKDGRQVEYVEESESGTDEAD